jgi:hypothetical protein
VKKRRGGKEGEGTRRGREMVKGKRKRGDLDQSVQKVEMARGKARKEEMKGNGVDEPSQ